MQKMSGRTIPAAPGTRKETALRCRMAENPYMREGILRPHLPAGYHPCIGRLSGNGALRAAYLSPRLQAGEILPRAHPTRPQLRVLQAIPLGECILL